MFENQRQSERCKAVIAIGPHNSCLILFAHGQMLECEISEVSADPDEIGFEYPEGLGQGIHVWEGEGVYIPDEDGGECQYNCKNVRCPTDREGWDIIRYNKSPWPELWPPKELPPPKSIGEKIVDGLEDFAEKLESGEPIPTTTVTRVDTPDGPMHVREEGTLNDEDNLLGHRWCP
jgi:hypothetical protein